MGDRIEWRFTEGTVLGPGFWYLEWGDPEREAILTLTEVVHLSDNPVWCLTEHAAVLERIVEACHLLAGDLDGALSPSGEELSLMPDSPMVTSVVRALHALHNATALLADALVEFRRGRVETTLLATPALACSLTFTLANAVNCTYLLERYLPHPD